MPRGGRRPGAGAPKGNFNGLKSGRRNERLEMIAAAMIACPDRRALYVELRRLGFYRPDGSIDTKRSAPYLWRKWFDKPRGRQSNAINRDQTPDSPQAAHMSPPDSGDEKSRNTTRNQNRLPSRLM